MYLDILEAIKKGNHKPTRIMNRTYVSWKPLMEVLDAMMKQNLLVSEKHSEHIIYNITEKGKNVLNYFNEAIELIEII